jgi:hypothetical protein
VFPWGDAAVEIGSVLPDPTAREAAMSTTEDRTSGASGMAERRAPGLLDGELREGYAELGDVRLHYVDAGDGPLVVLLHGFPEFLVRLAAAAPTARGGGIPGRRPRPARLQPVIAAG